MAAWQNTRQDFILAFENDTKQQEALAKLSYKTVSCRMSPTKFPAVGLSLAW